MKKKLLFFIIPLLGYNYGYSKKTESSSTQISVPGKQKTLNLKNKSTKVVKPNSVTFSNGLISNFRVSDTEINIGNPNIFGNNIWNVYAYNGSNFEEYRGFYTQSTLNFNTFESWDADLNPSEAEGYLGFPVTDDNHSYKAKRKGFPAGNYIINVLDHDDNSALYINGTEVFRHDGCCDSHSDAWQGYLDENSEVVIATQEVGGGSNANYEFELNTPAPGNPDIFGDNIWNVYAYSGFEFNRYKGYYTQDTVNFNTLESWDWNGSPSMAEGYQGSTIANDDHSFIAKRKGFPEGNYRINVLGHDDFSALIINGHQVFIHNGCCDSHANVWTGLLNNNSEIIIKTQEGGGESYANYEFVLLPENFCNLTLTAINSQITTTSVAGAKGYRFKVTNTNTNAVQTIDRSVNWFDLMMLNTYNYGTTYKVEVATKATPTGSYSGYSNTTFVCSPKVPTLTAAFCDKTVAAKNTMVSTVSMPNVTAYRFEIRNNSTDIVNVVERNTQWFTFNHLPANAYSTNTQYTVKIAVKTAGTWSPYGNACTINSPASARSMDAASDITENVFEMTTSPNPFSSDFGMALFSNSEEPVTITVYNLLGSQIERRTIKASEVSSLKIGDNYSSGIYNVVATQGENVKTLKVIKK
jgi:hypothetical protein